MNKLAHFAGGAVAGTAGYYFDCKILGLEPTWPRGSRLRRNRRRYRLPTGSSRAGAPPLASFASSLGRVERRPRLRRPSTLAESRGPRRYVRSR